MNNNRLFNRFARRGSPRELDPRNLSLYDLLTLLEGGMQGGIMHEIDCYY